MSITTTVHAPVEITRCRLTGLLAAVTAATAAVTWTVTTAAIDNNTVQPARATTSSWQYGALGNPLGLPITAADATVAADAEPIVVADAYHGTGFGVCPSGERPVAVADAYHGTGTTVCP
jgi:hypothetical protein